jgi:hypothetical protein
MADTKITALTALTAADPASDVLPIVDISDTTMAASGTTKKISVNNILGSGGTATLASATITGAATVGTTLGVTGGATVGGTLGVTGASTFTGAVVCNGAVTLGDAVGDAITATGSFTSYTGQNPSAIRAAASDYAAVAFDGATTDTRISSTLTGQAIGTGDFSIWCRFKISQTTSKAVFSMVEDGTNFLGLTTSSGAYGLDKTIGGVASNASITGFTGAAFAGQIVDFVLVRSAGVFSVYVNGSAYTLTNTTGNISFSAAATLRVGGYFVASQVFDKDVYRFVVFNRALSATDVTELITTGVNPADQWGTQTQIVNTTTLNGGFETAGGGGADVFANWQEYTAGTAVLSRDTVDYSPDLGSTASAKALGTDGTAVWSLSNATAGNFVPGKRYRLSAAHKRSFNATISWKTTVSNTGVLSFAVTTSWANYSGEFVMPKAESIKIDGGGNATLWIDNVIYERIGAIVDLDFTVGTGYQATDRSTNALHGTLFNGVEFTQPKKLAVLYATTSTSGNQQMLGTLAIPTNAVIEDIIVNSTGSATVSVGNASAGTQIVNGASVVSGRQKLTLATPFSTTGNLWVNSSTTATLQFTILYTIAA